PTVTMYTCGITPYAASHVGHAAAYVTYDVLQRRLQDIGHRTQCVRNITDVDDDILRRARELGVDYLDLAAEETARFEADMAALGVRRALVAVDVGAGPARLAHRVLGPGLARAGHHHRHPRRRHRPDLPPPRMRDGPVRGRHRPALRAPLGASGDGAPGRGED